MLITILLILKFTLFTNSIKVETSRIPIILISSFISIIIISLILGSKLKYKKGLIIAFYSIISLLMLADASYYDYFNVLPGIMVIKQLAQLTTVADSIFLILDLKKLLLILDLPLLIYYFNKRDLIEEKYQSIKHIPLILTLILSLIFVAFYKNDKLAAITSQELFTYHAKDIQNQIFSKEKNSNSNNALTDEDIQDLKERTRLKYGKLSGLGHNRNLIVLQVEALQNFVINLNYNGQEITPNLNRLIKDQSTVYYDKYYQLLGRGNTSDSEFVSHNSLHPSMEEPTYTQYANNTFYGLPWLLRDNNYHAWAFHGFEKEFWNREAAYVNQGFERFISQENFKLDESIGFGISDEQFFNQSIEYLKELDSIDKNPFYAFMVTLTSHTPFTMPEEHQYLHIKGKYDDSLLGNYLHSIHYADREIGKFIEKLKEEGLYDNTVIAIYGDHFAISSANEVDQKMLTEFLKEDYDFDKMMNIPLIIHIANEQINEKVSTVGSQLDFYPTIMNIMGYENTKGLIFGRDLTNYKGKNFVAPQTYMLKGSFIDDKRLFVISRDGIYNNSRAIDLKTRQALDLEDQRQEHEKAIKEINMSNYILETDYLKDYSR